MFSQVIHKLIAVRIIGKISKSGNASIVGVQYLADAVLSVLRIKFNLSGRTELCNLLFKEAE